MTKLRLKSVPISVQPKSEIYQLLVNQMNHSTYFFPVLTFNITMIGHHSKLLIHWLNQHALITPDGVGISFLLWFKYFKWVSRYPGIDMVTDLLSDHRYQYRVALVGASQEALAGTIRWVNQLGHDVVFSIHGFATFDVSDYEAIAQSRPQLILVAMGCPKQDQFIYEVSQYMNSGVAIGVGGSFDVWSGLKLRAPIVFRKFGLEWLYRLVLEPRRLFRLFRWVF